MKYIINEFIIYISFRLDDLFIKAAVFYMKDTIPVESSLENLFDFLNNIQHFYKEPLRKSIIVQNHCLHMFHSYNYGETIALFFALWLCIAAESESKHYIPYITAHCAP